MRIGNLGSLYHLFHGSILYTEGDIIVERIIKEDSLLIYITNKRT